MPVPWRKATKFGRSQQEEAWQNAEVDALYRLADAGVRVPKPYGCFDGVLLMELITDADGDVAPRLNDVAMTAEQALADHATVMTTRDAHALRRGGARRPVGVQRAGG